MELRNKTVLITGAALRIGREVALSLASHGAGIVIHYGKSKQAAAKLKDEIQDLGSQAFLVPCDFSGSKVEKKIASFVKTVYRTVLRIDVLINNASVFYPTPVGKIREKDWDEILNVNLKAPFFLSREIGQRMVKQGAGKIINLVDSSVIRSTLNYLPYSVSKAGLHLTTLTLARALAPKVQVNSIAPGPILPARGMTPKQEKAVADKTLLKRFGDPADICAAVKFLIEGTDYVTGALIPVDGGVP